MSKKLLLCFSLLATQGQVIKPMEFAQQAGVLALGRYAAATVASDLGFGVVTQHDTIVSQLFAAGRVYAYQRMLDEAIFAVRRSVKTNGVVSEVPVQFSQQQVTQWTPKDLLLICLIVPIAEELLFTYLPQLFLRQAAEEELPKARFVIPLVVSTLFGAFHDYPDNSWFNFFKVATGTALFTHHCYMNNRSLRNLTPIFTHVLNNSLFMHDLCQYYKNNHNQ
jgi:membrane protease YdiL (CAAX protease family)